MVLFFSPSEKILKDKNNILADYNDRQGACFLKNLTYGYFIIVKT